MENEEVQTPEQSIEEFFHQIRLRLTERRDKRISVYIDPMIAEQVEELIGEEEDDRFGTESLSIDVAIRSQLAYELTHRDGYRPFLEEIPELEPILREFEVEA